MILSKLMKIILVMKLMMMKSKMKNKKKNSTKLDHNSKKMKNKMTVMSPSAKLTLMMSHQIRMPKWTKLLQKKTRQMKS